MENLILTATFFFFWATHTAPPTAQLHKCKKTQPRFVLTRDAKWLKCVTVFPVSVCTFILFLYQDFQGKQHWLTNGHFQSADWGTPVSVQVSRIQEACVPPDQLPHAGRPPTNTYTHKHCCMFRKRIPTSSETRTVSEVFPMIQGNTWNISATE